MAFKRSFFIAIIGLLLTGALWLQEPLKHFQPGKPIVLYANQKDDDLTKLFLSAIDRAEQSIFLVIYALTDNKIISSLNKKAASGIDVHVVCDAKTSPDIRTLLGPHVCTITRFHPDDGLMHQKILVIDEKETWIGSANMTTESLRMHGNLVTSITDAEFAQDVLAKARSLKSEGEGRPFPHKEYTIGAQRIELCFLPDDPLAIARLQQLIASAKKTVRVAMFAWTRSDLAHSLIEASKRGVKAEVVIDCNAGKGMSAKIVTLLKKNGVAVALSRAGPLLHHKFLYIDNKTLVNGSANWTKRAFTENDDCFIIMHELTPQQQQRMDSLWNTIIAESL